MLSWFSFSTLKQNLNPTSMVIFLHGLGDMGKSWAPFFESMTWEFDQDTPKDNILFVFPNAEKRSVTLNMGLRMPAWYDLYSLQDPSDISKVVNGKEFEEDQNGLNISSAQILDLVLHLEKEYNIPRHKIILGGFSQGGALSLYAVLRHQSLAGIGGLIILSSYLPCSVHWISMSEKNPLSLPPTIMGHGSADPIVAHDWGFQSYQVLQKISNNSSIQFNSYPGMGHSSCTKEQTHIQRFIQNIVNK
jgi:predicted esterase